MARIRVWSLFAQRQSSCFASQEAGQFTKPGGCEELSLGNSDIGISGKLPTGSAHPNSLRFRSDLQNLGGALRRASDWPDGSTKLLRMKRSCNSMPNWEVNPIA